MTVAVSLGAEAEHAEKRPLLVVATCAAKQACGGLGARRVQSTLATTTLTALRAASNAPIFLVIAVVGLRILVEQASGFLLEVISGAMAQSSGSPAALAVLAVVHLLVVVLVRGASPLGLPSPALRGVIPALGLRNR